MVVCQYGSAVLFNVEDHEVESYLRIIQRHASGLLPEMKKDGKFFIPRKKDASVSFLMFSST